MRHTVREPCGMMKASPGFTSVLRPCASSISAEPSVMTHSSVLAWQGSSNAPARQSHTPACIFPEVEPKVAAVPNVASVEFVTREQAMQTFEAEYDSDLFDNIDASVFRHRYVVTLDDLSLMKDTQAALKNVDGIADVTAHLDYAENFITFRNIVSVVSVVLIVILIAVSLFIMTNTIKLATFGRREEIAIMKMVGATNGFIRLPFVVEGLVLGLVGGLVAFLLQWGLYSLIVSKIMSTMAAGIITVLPFASVALPLLLVFLGVGVLVGVFGGLTAIRNYLKV